MYYKLERVGEINYNKYKNKMKIIKYNSIMDIDVLFEDYDYVAKHKQYIAFKNGTLTSPYDRTIYGVGYLGEGLFKKNINNKATKEYLRWKSMMDRCYNNKQPTYKGCTVCEEWCNFQKFSKWLNENYYDIIGERMCLDKDILHKGNKIYEPKSCMFVPNAINILFVRNEEHRNGTPIGVRIKNNKYEASCNDNNGTHRYLGVYLDAHEAFNAYKEYKEKLIKQVADKYKYRIPETLYQAMYNSEVEIDD